VRRTPVRNERAYGGAPNQGEGKGKDSGKGKKLNPLQSFKRRSRAVSRANLFITIGPENKSNKRQSFSLNEEGGNEEAGGIRLIRVDS